MLAIVLLPKFIEKEIFDNIREEYAHKFKLLSDVRVAINNVNSNEYKCLNEDEYFIEDVQIKDGVYYNNEGVVINSWKVYEHPKKDIVVLSRPFALVDIERFARCAIGIPFTILDVA